MNLEKLLGKLVVVELSNGRVFSSRLAQIDNNEIWFCNRSGKYIMDRRDQIIRIYELEKPNADEIEVVT